MMPPTALALRAPDADRVEAPRPAAAAPGPLRHAAGRVAGHLPAAAARGPLAPGERLQGVAEYQAVRELGRGASGIVYLARDVALHRTVAVKVLPAPHRGCAESCERFRREARMTAQLAHPNIVPLYAFGEAADAMYIVMQYVDGGSLADRLRATPRLPAAEARRLLADLALALDHAHRRGVVHRDVKPENVLLDRESGRAMLTDFGVATRRWWDVTPSELRRAFGTPAFMSPEQALGEPNVDGRSDLYAVGVLGYAMLSGTVPFDGRDPFAVTARRLSGDAPPLRALAPGAPAELVAAIERCLAADAGSRWTSARELHDALAGARTVPRPPSALSRRLRAARTSLGRALRPR
jgi:serine/threonine-protein kinase